MSDKGGGGYLSGLAHMEHVCLHTSDDGHWAREGPCTSLDGWAGSLCLHRLPLLHPALNSNSFKRAVQMVQLYQRCDHFWVCLY